MNYRIGRTARTQLTQILIRSAFEHGGWHADNYRLLIETAMEEIAANPRRLGARALRQAPGIWGYEIWYSRTRVPRERRVRYPWHKLIYTQGADGTVEILAIVGRSYPSGRAAREALATL